jgi:hypothetical protein
MFYYRKLERPADVRVIWSLENLFSGRKNSDRKWLKLLFQIDLLNKLNWKLLRESNF